MCSSRPEQSPVLLPPEEGQVELGRARVHVERREGEIADPERRPGLVLEHEHDLEQRVAAHVALGLDLLDELLERELVVGIGAEGDLAHAAQQLAEARPAPHVGAQDQGVGEEADQSLDLGPVAVGSRRADRDVGLARGTREEPLEGRQQDHEQRRALTPGEALEILARGPPAARPAAASPGRSRQPVAAGRAAESGRALPARRSRHQASIGRERIAPQTLSLPGRVVGVLDRQRRQSGDGRPADKAS